MRCGHAKLHAVLHVRFYHLKQARPAPSLPLLQLTRQLLRKGNSVVATARTPSSATQLHQLAAEHANKLTITQLDVTKMSSIEVGRCSCLVSRLYVVQMQGEVLDSSCYTRIGLANFEGAPEVHKEHLNEQYVRAEWLTIMYACRNGLRG